MALLMGMVLMGGATALMVRMMSARKLSASESYQQLAEAAAVNGFNRILATLNSPQKQNYLGYLYLINNIEGNNGVYGWSSLPEIEEPCASKLATAPNWHDADVELQDNGTTLRNDSAGDLRTYYRLRRYIGPSQTSSAQFEVEGIVKREGSQKAYEARSLLKRSLFVNSRVPTENDWGVLAGRNLKLNGLTLSDASNDGKGGLIMNLLTANSSFDTSNSDSCNASNLLGLVNASNTSSSLANHIWPVKNITNNNWDIPATEYFNGDNTTDTAPGDSVTRIWAISDDVNGNPLDENYGLQCGSSFSPICSRPTSNNPDSQHSIPIAQSQIEMTTEEALATGEACVVKKAWETKTNQYSAGEIYDRPERCNSAEDRWQRRVEWQNREEIVTMPTYTITLKESDLCASDSGSPQSNVCHIYIEQLNLKRSSILIENSSNRPIVLHLETPDGVERRSEIKSIENTDYIYELTGNSQLCGINKNNALTEDNINQNSGNINNCNLHPERFIIASNQGDATTACYGNEKLATLRFGSSNIPAAIINMPNGNIEFNNNTSMKAVIWASSICIGNGNQLALSTTSADGNTAIVTKAEEQWQWAEEKRYGRTVARGIRGTGFDTFSRW
ncbi:hypothetical protein N9997_02605 [Synechococcus sp. AH-603-L18]|nr:hypothetical protein [Synechococcus sp. AH-603-L18]